MSGDGGSRKGKVKVKSFLPSWLQSIDGHKAGAWIKPDSKDEGTLVFPLLSKLGSALATLYNSSSMAERDFSLMNAIVADKSRTSQLLLLAKMYIKAEIMGLARSCKQCKVLSSVDEDGRHCHCHLWQPTDELMDTMRGGQPYRRYKADMEKRKQEEEDKQVLKDLNAQEDERKRLEGRN